MLTLKHILTSARMMKQTGGEYRGFYQDHIPEYSADYFLARKDSSGKRIKFNLQYETSKDGDLRIVQS